MKKTGSIRVEIEEEYDRLNYTVNIMGVYQGRLEDEQTKIAVILPKSAVAGIREEVDWSKVEYNTPVAVWNIEGIVRIGFYRGMNDAGYYVVSWVDGKSADATRKHAMLLTDWLKEHGGQDE